MEQRKKLPIGIQTFKDIRDVDQNYIYVDKTSICNDLLSKGRYYFLSRPRRFGKSLLLDTFSEICSGSKDLFKGLFIYDKWDWNVQYPVIKIDFGTGDFASEQTIRDRIQTILSRNCDALNIDKASCEDSDLGTYLEQLILRASSAYNKKVIVLVDEYDKPILDNIRRTEKSVALTARKILRNLYSAIKISDPYLRFVFITGVSKFSRLNLFSGLNNIEDITVDARYATITGYTQEELESSFSDFTQGVDMQELKRWYNGYNYLGKPVYNPFDVLLFFAKGNQFENYWWETGNPLFLIEKLKEQPQFLPDFQNKLVSKETLNAFDVEHIDLVALLWQTGYLTFAEKIVRMNIPFYKLKVPNLEIQCSLNALFFDYLTNFQNKKTDTKIAAIEALLNVDMPAFENTLRSLFASIPYQNYVNNTIGDFEGYYASVIFAFLSSLGFTINTEDCTNVGRIDMTLIGPDSIFILEFKVDMPAEAALHQIKTKRYYEKYLSQGKQIHLIGIQFDSEQKNLVGFEHEVFQE